MTKKTFQIRLRMYYQGEIALGPGKIALLEALSEEGSIKKAAMAMNMSYKRAWSLIRTMNESFLTPLVSTSKGGEHGGGTTLTEKGIAVVRQYREIEADMLHSHTDALQSLQDLLGKKS